MDHGVDLGQRSVCMLCRGVEWGGGRPKAAASAGYQTEVVFVESDGLEAGGAAVVSRVRGHKSD